MKKKLLICDLDNTIYDWSGYFVPAFYQMIDEVVRLTSCDREELLDDFKSVHQLNHDSEHPFALLDTRTIKNLYPMASRQELAISLNSAFHAFNSSRKRNLRLYPGVLDALVEILATGTTIVAHTEGKLFSVLDRLRRLGLGEIFSKIYCRQRSLSRHPSPEVSGSWLDQFPMSKVTELSHHQRKPNATVVLEICQTIGVKPSECAYVGDSIARDILMAKKAGVFSIWAKYGATSEENYRKLVRVSHWTSADVERERELNKQAMGIYPDLTLALSFREILTAVP